MSTAHAMNPILKDVFLKFTLKFLIVAETIIADLRLFPWKGVSRMVILAGIDEAGFGPLLGPLVVSSAAFSLPNHFLTADLWQLLRKSVANTQKHLAGRLLITDSKKAYSRKKESNTSKGQSSPASAASVKIRPL